MYIKIKIKKINKPANITVLIAQYKAFKVRLDLRDTCVQRLVWSNIEGSEGMIL